MRGAGYLAEMHIVVCNPPYQALKPLHVALTTLFIHKLMGTQGKLRVFRAKILKILAALHEHMVWECRAAHPRYHRPGAPVQLGGAAGSERGAHYSRRWRQQSQVSACSDEHNGCSDG